MAAGQVLARFDVAQIAIYVFWGFFAGLVWFLRREDHREGYPLVAEFPGQGPMLELPPMPSPKAFIMNDGHVRYAPRPEAPETFAAEQTLAWPGAPYHPTGNPMIDGVGPAAYAMRHDEPELAYDDGLPKIVPLRTATDFFLSSEDPDPRGFDVQGADGRVAGKIVDAWIDRSEYIVRYLEVETSVEYGSRRVLLPMHFSTVRARQHLIKVHAVLAHHFADAPLLRNPDQVTPREEDRICGYFAGGLMYATPARSEPLL
jgi:photosynthetic reaction center H subunit